MKATEQYFPVVLFIMLYKVVLTFGTVEEILKCAIQLKATEQYFPLVFLTVVQKVALKTTVDSRGTYISHKCPLEMTKR